MSHRSSRPRRLRRCEPPIRRISSRLTEIRILMPRLPRVVLPGAPVHVTQRGNNRTATFRSADDFDHYLSTLLDACRRFRCAIHAYVLMTNHVHLLITPEDNEGLSLMMQAIGRRYVRYVNARYRRTGTLWEGRFRSAVIDSERYFFTCSRYIELNPVRAQMVDHPHRYRWSSHRYNAFGEPDALIAPHPLYCALAPTPVNRQAVYRALFRNEIEPQTLEQIRRATNRGAVLGDARFLDRIEATLDRRVRRLAHGGDRRSPAFHASQDLASGRLGGGPRAVAPFQRL